MIRKELISADQAAQLLNVTRRTLLRWAREKKIECVRISSKTILFATEAIDEFVDRSTHGVESLDTNQRSAGEKKARPETKKKGGDKKNSGERWNDLRKEVQTWQ